MKFRVIAIITGIVVGCLCGFFAVSLLNLSSSSTDKSKITTKAIINKENYQNCDSVSQPKNIPASKDASSSVANSSNANAIEDNSSTDNAVTENSDADSSIFDGSTIGTTKETGEKVVYLTFDDGPSKQTPKILDILDKYDIKATFFVTGFDPNSAEYIKIAHDKGHTIGMHTYSHDYSDVYSSVDAYYNDLNKIADLCKQQLGYIPHYIRFPGGSSNTVSRKYTKGIMTFLSKDVLKKGYQYYDWNSANGDAQGGKPTAQQLYNNAISYVGGTDLVMLCHDSGDKNATVQSLPKIIEYYKSKGYAFKAIDDTSFVAHHTSNN